MDGGGETRERTATPLESSIFPGLWPRIKREGGKHSCAAHMGFPKDLLDEKYSRSDEFRIKEAQLESRKPERASRRRGILGVQLEFRLPRYSRLFRPLRLKYFESHKYLDFCEKEASLNDFFHFPFPNFLSVDICRFSFVID